MLKSYTETLGKLSEVERTLMLHRIRELHVVMQPGYVSINWNALGIRDYIESCSKGIQDFLVRLHVCVCAVKTLVCICLLFS